MGNTQSNETRDRIVIAARELFVQHGQHGVNMRELAERAGVNKGLLHYYFKTKESIFREVFQHQAGRLYAQASSRRRSRRWWGATSRCSP